jgi:hypothetical protein
MSCPERSFHQLSRNRNKKITYSLPSRSVNPILPHVAITPEAVAGGCLVDANTGEPQRWMPSVQFRPDRDLPGAAAGRAGAGPAGNGPQRTSVAPSTGTITGVKTGLRPGREIILDSPFLRVITFPRPTPSSCFRTVPNVRSRLGRHHGEEIKRFGVKYSNSNMDCVYPQMWITVLATFLPGEI